MDDSGIPARRALPGRLLKRELDARGWSQKELAEIIGRPEQVISEIVNGIKQITPETAIEFSRAFGTSDEFWNNLEANYQLWRAQKSSAGDSISRRAKLFQLVPVSELKKKGWLPDTKDTDDLEKSYLDLMGISSMDVIPKCVVCKRQSTIKDGYLLPEVIWIKRVEQLISNQNLKKFNVDEFKASIPDLLELSIDIIGVSQVPEFLLKNGIHFALVPHLSNTKIDGAFFWFNNSPVIALSIRYDRIDSFWFTLMHEIAHLFAGHRGNLIETIYDRDKTVKGNEAAADKMATNWLIEKGEYESFLTRPGQNFSRKSISAFSEQINRHPGIVLGRLHNDGHVSWKNLRGLLDKVKSQLIGSFDKPILSRG